MSRPLGQVVLVTSAAGVVGGAIVLLAAFTNVLPPDSMLILPLLAPVCAGALGVTLWMGLRWTIVHADRRGLRLELRGFIFERHREWPREQITGLRRGMSLYVLGADGRKIGRIDATDQTEERWLCEVLRQALDLPQN